MRFLKNIVFAAIVLFALSVGAGTLAVTDFPASGTLTASMLNARFAQVEARVNGGLGDANISSSEPLSLAKIQNDYSRFCTSEVLTCSATVANAFVTRVPATGYITSAYVSCHGCSGADIDLLVQVDSTTVATFTGIANTTTQTSTGLTGAVASTNDVNVDITVNTVGSCTGLDVTICYALPHVNY